MAKRKAKRAVRRANSSPDVHENCAEEPQLEKQGPALADCEVERQVGAIRAIRDVEIECLLTEVRLLRSYFTKEQLLMPVSQFFKEKLPHLSIEESKENKQLEVKWRDKDGTLSMNHLSEKHIRASLLQRFSMGFHDFSAGISSFGGFDFTARAARGSCTGADNWHASEYILEEPSDTWTVGMPDSLRTPGVSSQRLSVGMTPKTLRQPKNGEMLLSVRGSPLGVYKEDNMEAIRESEEG